MVKSDAIGASITKQVCVACTVLRVVHVSVAVHLKPVDVCLLGQADYLLLRREDNHLLFQQVVAELNRVIDHAMIADSAIIHAGVVFVIGHVVPQP